MVQPLFFEPDLIFEKVGGETTLPEDPNQWPTEILQELFKQVPYIADFDPRIQLERVDAEQGFGFGSVEVGNQTEAPVTSNPEQQEAAGLRKVRIPIIIKESKLQPLDVLVTDDSKMMPLTESRLRRAIFRPQAFDVTSKTPGDQSMIGQLYPPYRQNYGFGGGGVTVNAGMGGKTASVLEDWLEKEAAELTQAGREKIKSKNFAVPKGEGPGDTGKYPIHDAAHARNALTRVRQFGSSGEKSKVYAAVAKKYPGLAERSSVPAVKKKVASVLEAILPTINETDHSAFMGALADKNLQAAFMKNAAATLDCLKLLAEHQPQSQVKIASALPSFITPSVLQLRKVEDGYVIKTASHLFWAPYEESIDRGEAVRRCGEKIVLAADMSGSATVGDEGVAAEEETPERVQLVSEPGTYKVQDSSGRELVGLVIPNLLDLDGQSLPLSLFTNGSDSGVQGEIVGVRVGEATSTPKDEPSGKGVFCTTENGKLVATIPLDIKGRFSAPSTEGAEKIVAEAYDGRQVELSRQPGLKKIVSMGTEVFVPDSYKWLPLEASNAVSLVGDPDIFDKKASAERILASVTVRCGGTDSYSFRGPVLEKLASDDTDFLDQDQALFLLSSLGTNLGYAQKKLAEAYSSNAPVQVKIGRGIKTAHEARGEASIKADEYLSRVPTFRCQLWKEAAVLPDPTAVDAVLSLGFINPENLVQFISYLPELDEAQQKMSELLIASRLGLKELPQSALERSLRAVEEVIEGLKVIAFQE